MSESLFAKAPEIPHTDILPSINFAEFKKVVESRRSVRVYEQESIPDSIVRECLELALLAPNSSNLQSWEFFWVRSPGKKEELVRACLSQPTARTADTLIVSVARTGTWRAQAQRMVKILRQNPNAPKSALDYYEKLIPLSHTMGPLGIMGLIRRVVTFFVGIAKPIPRGPFSRTDLRLWAVKSAALACENLMLAFRAAGYDTCPMEGMDAKRVKKLLALPRDAVVVMVISAGKRSSKGIYGPRLRFPSEEFIKIV